MPDCCWRCCMTEGSDRWQARLYVLACVVLAISTTWLAVKISYTQKHFSTALAEKNQGEQDAAAAVFALRSGATEDCTGCLDKTWPILLKPWSTQEEPIALAPPHLCSSLLSDLSRCPS